MYVTVTKPSVLWRWWLGSRKGIRSVRNEWWVLAWLSVWVRCRFAYGSDNLTATHYLLLQEIQIGFGFTFLLSAHPASPGQNPENCKTVVVVIVIHVRNIIISSQCTVNIYNRKLINNNVLWNISYLHSTQIKQKLQLARKYQDDASGKTTNSSKH